MLLSPSVGLEPAVRVVQRISAVRSIALHYRWLGCLRNCWGCHPARHLDLDPGAEASPTAGVIDSQSVKTTESGGPRGFDAGKKIMGRKRHIVTDTQGHLVGLVVQPANIQDRNGGPGVLASIRSLYSWLRHVFCGGGYAGIKIRQALTKIGTWKLEIIKRSDIAQCFQVLPRHWVVERTFAWIGRCRRLAKDFEATIASAVAWVFVAHIRTLTRKLARPLTSCVPF
jgi:putative transposase